MKTVIATKKPRATPLSKVCNLTSSYRVIEKKASTVKDKSGNIVLIYLPQALSASEIKAGRALVRYKQSTTNRGMAAGVNPVKAGKYKGSMGTANTVNSSIIGYMENNVFATCRQTTMTRKHRDVFNKETMKVLRKVSTLFRKHAPTQYRKQKAFVKKVNPNMVLPGTVYTTATVNVDFRTRTHKDKGDYNAGLGNLCVFQEEGKKWSGSEFLLPDYNIAVRLQEGDVLFANVHETHCNAKRKGDGRISLVLYARQALEKKCTGTSKKELEEGKIR